MSFQEDADTRLSWKPLCDVDRNEMAKLPRYSGNCYNISAPSYMESAIADGTAVRRRCAFQGLRPFPRAGRAQSHDSCGRNLRPSRAQRLRQIDGDPVGAWIH